MVKKQQATSVFKAIQLQYLKLKGQLLPKTFLNSKAVEAYFGAASTLNSKDNSIYSHVCMFFFAVKRASEKVSAQKKER